MSEKVKTQHVGRKALLYIRQSSVYQVNHDLESQKLQYAMQDLSSAKTSSGSISGWQQGLLLIVRCYRPCLFLLLYSRHCGPSLMYLSTRQLSLLCVSDLVRHWPQRFYSCANNWGCMWSGKRDRGELPVPCVSHSPTLPDGSTGEMSLLSSSAIR